MRLLVEPPVKIRKLLGRCICAIFEIPEIYWDLGLLLFAEIGYTPPLDRNNALDSLVEL
jgi:hypothetical protein